MTLSIAFDNSFARLGNSFSAQLAPTPVAAPELVAINTSLAAELGLDADALRSSAGIAVLAGNSAPDGAQPLAQAYAGHQFGNFVPQLGDGRAILLGEVFDTNGIRRDLQLKGSGRTPFSRGGDGRAWLGPILREYIVSEAMHALGIPTTRALAAVKTGEAVIRERPLPGAILTRVAQSHIRVGTFQFFAVRGQTDQIRALTDHVIERHYPDVDDAFGLLQAVIKRHAYLIARWMSVGFIHGVMNTDNCQIAGETIDYGPCAFMDDYHPGRVFSSIDQQGRYAYQNQPDIAVWNLAQFASCLLPLIHADEETAITMATEVINEFGDQYQDIWLNEFRAKLGLSTSQDNDIALISEFLQILTAEKSDFTNTFRDLTDGTPLPDTYTNWIENWHDRRLREGSNDADQTALMRRANPAYIPRNHQIESAIQAATSNDFDLFHRLNDALSSPYDPTDQFDWLRAPPGKDEVVHQTFCGT